MRLGVFAATEETGERFRAICDRVRVDHRLFRIGYVDLPAAVPAPFPTFAAPAVAVLGTKVFRDL